MSKSIAAPIHEKSANSKPATIHVYTEIADGTRALEVRHELHDSGDPEERITLDELAARRDEIKEVEEGLAMLMAW